MTKNEPPDILEIVEAVDNLLDSASNVPWCDGLYVVDAECLKKLADLFGRVV